MMIGTRFKLAILAVVLVALATGCGQRDNPADPDPTEEGYVGIYIRQFGGPTPPETWLNQRSRTIRIYFPPSYPWNAPAGEGEKFPTLYLLHDFDGAEDYYLFSCVNQVADKLIASGEIKPMLIVMPDASAAELGTFCTDGWSLWNPDEVFRTLSGDFEKMIWDDLIYFMEVQSDPGESPFSLIPRRDSRAIGGVGMGGYGALKIAMKHPELFGSVSCLNGLTSFGDMLEPLIDDVFAENGISIGDEEDYLTKIDTSYSKPVTNLIFSMAAAFSPWDTTASGSEDPPTLIRRYGVELPFDYNGDIVQSVLDRWLEHDLTSTIADYELFNGYEEDTDLYIDYSDRDRYGAGDQARSFMAQLDQLGVLYKHHEYEGYSGYPADDDEFNIERLEEMLKFHSKHLSDDPGEQ